MHVDINTGGVELRLHCVEILENKKRHGQYIQKSDRAAGGYIYKQKLCSETQLAAVVVVARIQEKLIAFHLHPGLHRLVLASSMAKAQKTESDLNISLESHLEDALRPLPKLLPAELCDRLLPYLDAPKTAAPATDAPRRTIPYALLDAISKWSRTTAGLDALTAQTPKLDPRSYTMIALLAGTTTSPERKFPAYVPQEDLDAQARQRTKDDKRALTTLLNALLSIGGCGFATWWAADRLHWRNEWVSTHLYAQSTLSDRV